ncbi:MAG: putative glucosyl-3-phosphoglycerate synthase [Acidimicrobiaceae bacterium]|nr:putative glucosyl-3-phosphoglycerate synthase [Acidimicrobiaceae bacterium]
MYVLADSVQELMDQIFDSLAINHKYGLRGIRECYRTHIRERSVEVVKKSPRASVEEGAANLNRMTPHNVPWSLTGEDFHLEEVLEAALSTTVSVIIPARNESSTIGAVIEAVLHHEGLVTELLVVNDYSSDDTATVAARHGAQVITLDEASGKGRAMSAGLKEATSELVVFLDADVTNTSANYVPQLIQPLLERSEIQLVKGYYVRPLHDMPTGGGRVNELAARPILSLLFPGLGEIRQPLAGETAGRRSAFADITLEPTYGVEIAMLIDMAQRFGVQSLAQVDLGTRRHRNRPIEELRPMAVDVLRAALERHPPS